MTIDWQEIHAAVWRRHKRVLRPVTAIDPVTLDSPVGIDRQIGQLRRNTERFVARMPANNALLWGARGTGKSSLQ